uniref:Uncharacterized protein n=1 Tax=Micrurus paraensis TaxID=1970185 RepID=A0A2D4KYI1_9SAUR
MPALNKPATGTVTNQARKILRKRCQSTAFLDRIQPTATTEPTLQCVVLTGSPTLEAITTVNAEANSIVKPLDGVIGVRSFPIVWITLLPQTQRPTQMPMPPYSSSQIGVGASCITPP